ncbi:unnamed protein product, partial [Ectocarpus sp. 12 AP-2014]
ANYSLLNHPSSLYPLVAGPRAARFSFFRSRSMTDCIIITYCSPSSLCLSLSSKNSTGRKIHSYRHNTYYSVLKERTFVCFLIAPLGIRVGTTFLGHLWQSTKEALSV